MPRRKSAEHVVAGGKAGELGHCTHCGGGLSINLPQPVSVITAAMCAFTKAHSGCKPGAFAEPVPKTVAQWLAGRDTGISSLTIYYVMNGKRQYLSDDTFEHSPPCDPSDFGRCYRLLQLVPEWRAHLSDVAAAFPEWAPFVREWAKLEQLYEVAMQRPREPAPEMYQLMQKLREERNGKEKASG